MNGKFKYFKNIYMHIYIYLHTPFRHLYVNDLTKINVNNYKCTSNVSYFWTFGMINNV